MDPRRAPLYKLRQILARVPASPVGEEYHRVTRLWVNPTNHHLVVEYEGANMALQTLELDPNAVSYTDDEIVGKVNAATVKVAASALDPAAARDNLLAMPDADRGAIFTNPATGDFKIIYLQRKNASGKVEATYDDQPVP